MSCGGCGYESLNTAGAGGGWSSLCVALAPGALTNGEAAQGALDGAREELAQYAALRAGAERPCLMLELLRVDESPIGMAAADSGAGAFPRARGTSVAILGRSWVESSSGERSRDTGDLRRSASAAVNSTDVADVQAHRGLVRAAAERFGRAAARSILGLPTVSDELP
jgi:hypothetical protein